MKKWEEASRKTFIVAKDTALFTLPIAIETFTHSIIPYFTIHSLIKPRPMQLVLDTKGLTLSKKNGIFHVFDDKRERVISPGKLSSIAITANVRIDSSAVTLAVKHEIPILFFDNIGRPQARLWRPYFSTISTLRRKQVYFADHPAATAWMIDSFELKAQGQVKNLVKLKSYRKGLSSKLTTTITTIKANAHNLEPFRETLIGTSRNNIMGVEGAMARAYWGALGSHLPRAYRFKQRSRRPAKDIFNAALNYLYGMLYTVVEGAILSTGLDTHLGLLHTDEYTKPTLTFDLIEPFRPWMDLLLIEACFKKEIDTSFFTKNQYGIFLNKAGKAYFIPLFNDFMRSNSDFLGQNTSTKNHIYGLADKLTSRIRSTFK